MKTTRRTLLSTALLLAAAALAFSVQATVTNVAWYRFGESDPSAHNNTVITTAVDSIAFNNLTFTNSSYYTNDVSATAALKGSSLSAHIAAGAYGIRPIISTASDNFGIEAWVKPSSLTNGQVIAYNGSTSISGWGLFIGQNGLGSNEFLGLYGGNAIIDGGPAVSNVWTHFALVCAGGQTTIYINGVATVTNAAGPRVPAGNFAVGAPPQTPTSQFYTGGIDELRIFTFAQGQFSTNDLLINQPASAVPQIVTTLADSGGGSLREVVSSAASGATVTFATNGVVTLTSGPITVTNNVTIDGSALSPRIQINGNAASCVMVVTNGATAILNSLIITNGLDNTGNFAGGILNYATLTVSNCIFAGNSETAAQNGGGGAIQNTGGTLRVYNSVFSNNVSNGGDGGGGGAIDIFQGTVTINNCTFTNNSTSGNGSWGGAINNSSSLLTLTNCTLSGNLAGDTGGAIYSAGNGASLTLDSCTLSGNIATNSGNTNDGGGAIFNYYSPLTLYNCTIAANSTTNGGGAGIYIGGASVVTAVNCTIVSNSASGSYPGGGIDVVSGTLNLTNTIVAANTASASNNIAGVFNGVDNLTAGNPLLAPIGFYGGPTETMPPLAGSPAIDAGDDSITNILSTDQRGLPRLAGAHMDIGAAELQVPSLVITSPTSGQVVTNLNIAVSGTATASDGVAAVYVIDAGGHLIPATTSDNWTNWTATVTLAPFTNTLSAYAVSDNGLLSLTNSVTFDYSTTNFTTVTNHNKTDGILTLVINGAGPANSPNKVTPLKNGALVAVSNKVTLTALPGRNWILSNWVFGTSQPYSETNSLTLKFVMQSNFVVEGNFITNVFLPMQGTYYGLFAPTNGARAQTNSGAITFSVTHTGSLSGKLAIGDTTAALSGSFNAAGLATVAARLKGFPATTATIQLDFANQLATGSVNNSNFDSPLLAKLNVFGAANKATNFDGQYTFIIPGTTNPSIGPRGIGYGTAKISTTGAVTVSGALADGTSFSGSSALGKDGLWPLYLPLYKGAGSFWSWNYFDSNGIVSSNQFPVTNVAPSWINDGNSARNALYPGGFTNTNAFIYGSPYVSSDHPLLSDMAGDAVIIEGGDLTNALTNTLATSGSVEESNIVLTLTKTTGTVSGQFLDGTKKIKVNGVLLQGQSNVAGFFLGTNQSGSFQLAP